ncbi:methanobactin [Rivihabitans pingtungensis]|nr:methanobactin [Rivihabitans pingtungensis]MCK6436527.1 methanobactin [Rivihabitans pingtungensis]
MKIVVRRKQAVNVVGRAGWCCGACCAAIGAN